MLSCRVLFLMMFGGPKFTWTGYHLLKSFRLAESNCAILHDRDPELRTD